MRWLISVSVGDNFINYVYDSITFQMEYRLLRKTILKNVVPKMSVKLRPGPLGKISLPVLLMKNSLITKVTPHKTTLFC